MRRNPLGPWPDDTSAQGFTVAAKTQLAQRRNSMTGDGDGNGSSAARRAGGGIQSGDETRVSS